MRVNEMKKPGTKMPDYVCNQENGECMTEDGKYPTGAWAKKTFPTKATAPHQAPAVDPSVWEAKDRLYAAQTSLNAAAAIFQGSGDLEAVLLAAPHLYSFLREAKLGILAKPERKDVKTETMIKEAKEVEEIGEQIKAEDIPF